MQTQVHFQVDKKQTSLFVRDKQSAVTARLISRTHPHTNLFFFFLHLRVAVVSFFNKICIDRLVFFNVFLVSSILLRRVLKKSQALYSATNISQYLTVFHSISQYFVVRSESLKFSKQQSG